MERDLTVGSPMKLIFKFLLPLTLGMLFQVLYNMVDTAVVGKFLGVEALAGVGATGSINFLILGFCLGTCDGFGIPVAQEFGARNYKGVRHCVAAMVYLSAIVSVVLTAASVYFCRDILVFLKTPENIIEHAYNYIVTIFWGIPTLMFYNSLAGIMRALGDSKSPVKFLIMSAIINVVLDLVFILVFHMGVFGAALATVIAQGVSGVSCFLYLRKKFPILRLTRDDWKIRPHVWARMCYNGIPMGLQYSITAVGTVVVTKAVNGLGSDAVASVTAAEKISYIFTCVLDALGAAVATFCGQNVGAGKLERVRKGVLSAGAMGIVYCACAFLLNLFLCKYLLLLFVDPEQTAILALSRQYLIINVGTSTLLMLVIMVRLAIQGMGFGVLAILAGILEMVARVVVALWLVPAMGFLGACLNNPAAWLAADAFLIPAFFLCLRSLERKQVQVRQ